MSQFVITRVAGVAPGRFAPGHLGELTQQVPFEMVDAVLAQTGRVQSRVRDLPARVVVYLLLAGCLFAELSYGQVWHRLVAGLEGLAVAHPGASGLTQARRRLGAAPLRALFDLLRGPAAVPGAAAGVRWRGLLVCANLLRNLASCRPSHQHHNWLRGRQQPRGDTPRELGPWPRYPSPAVSLPPPCPVIIWVPTEPQLTQVAGTPAPVHKTT